MDIQNKHVRTVDSVGRIVLLSDICQEFGINAHDKLIITSQNGVITLTKFQ